MAAIRSLLLRRSNFSLLRERSLHFSAAISPLKTLTSSSSSATPWKWNVVRHRTKSSTSAYEDTYEDSSVNKKGVLEDYKFAYENFKPRELDITEIEGCDMNHWLITVDFPKNPRPSPEDMVRFYEETVAKSLNLSLEDAKKKIYACSTSNYTGFHVEVTEEESEKFRGKPGVVFILPDSYVDKEKKEYGGDKYINGIIIPRPRPNMIGKNQADPKMDQPNQQDQTFTQPNQLRIPPPYGQQEPDRPNEPAPAHRPNQQDQTFTQPNQLRIPPPYSQQEPDRPNEPAPAHRPNQQDQTFTQPNQLRIPPPYSQQEPGLNQKAPPSYPPNYGPPTQGPPSYSPTHYNYGPGPNHRAPPPSYPQNYGPSTQGPSMNNRGPPQNYGPFTPGPGPSHGAPPNYPQNYGPSTQGPGGMNYAAPPSLAQNYGPSTQGPGGMNYVAPPSYAQNYGPGMNHRAPPPSYLPANYGPPMAFTFVRIPYVQRSFAPYQEIYYSPPRPPCHWQGGYNTAPSGYGQPYGYEPGGYLYHRQAQPNWQGYGPPQGYSGPTYGDYQNYGPQPQEGSSYGKEQQDGGGGYQPQGPRGGYWR